MGLSRLTSRDPSIFRKDKSEDNKDLQYVKAGKATVGGWRSHNYGRKRKGLSSVTFVEYAELKRLASIRYVRFYG